MKRVEKTSITEMEKKEKILSIGIYTLLIVVTVAVMLILFNVFK